MAVGLLRGVLAAALLAGLVTGPLVDAPAAVAAGRAPAHPDDDYMGSTVAAHEPAAAQSGVVHSNATAATTSLPGLDVSHYQGTIDWAGVAGGGAKFAYMKATEGTTFVDPEFGANYAGSASAGILRGAYHFALPDTSSGAAQANFFMNNGGGWADDGRTLPPVLDIEYDPYGASCYGLTPAQMVAWITDFANTIHNATDRWPVIYSTVNWWTSCTGNDTTLGVNSPLWIAHPGADAGTLPAGWSNYTFWQYASSGTYPGDQDWFNGAQSDLTALAGGTDKLADHYAALGGSSSYLGTPTGGPFGVAGGWEQDYTGGALYYWPTIGAHAVHGRILDHYRQLSGPAGFLGFPVTDETGTPDGIGRYNHFSNDGSIYWTQNTGAYSVHGLIRDKWAALGWEAGPMGYPVTDETGTPDGVGRFNHFSKSASIYYTPGTGAHAVQGAIHAHWAALGWEAGPMGYPTTDEVTTPDGIGRFNHFSKDASIYWTPGTGAWSVHGAIQDRWASLGWERGGLGYPVSDEFGISGGRRTNFQHGWINWYAGNGATQVFYG